MAYQVLTEFLPPVDSPPATMLADLFASGQFPTASLGYLTEWLPPVEPPPAVEYPHYAFLAPTEFPTYPFVAPEFTPPELTNHPYDYDVTFALTGYSAQPANFVATSVPAASCALTLGQLKTRVAAMLDDSGFVYYTENEIKHALNVAQRLFCLITLCIERTVSFSLTNAQTFYEIDGQISDFIVPLRVSFSGARLKPYALHGLDMIDATWRVTAGATPLRYAQEGFNMLAIHPTPASGSNSLSIVYAAEPAELSAEGDTPEIPSEQHIFLQDAAFWLLRLKEGGQELAAAVKYLKRFLEAAEHYQLFTRARSRAQSYDRYPPDLLTFDKSRFEIKLKNAPKTKKPEGPQNA